MSGEKPAVFLDRDGVINSLINRDGGLFSPQTYSDFHVFPWAPLATNLLRSCGFLVFVVTNQPDISRGRLDQWQLDQMHEMLMEKCCIDAIFVCPHDSQDNCSCRKPKTALVEAAVSTWSVSLSESWVVGDRTTDIDLGRRVGARTIFVMGGQEHLVPSSCDYAVETLLHAAQLICQRSSH